MPEGSPESREEDARFLDFIFDHLGQEKTYSEVVQLLSEFYKTDYGKILDEFSKLKNNPDSIITFSDLIIKGESVILMKGKPPNAHGVHWRSHISHRGRVLDRV